MSRRIELCEEVTSKAIIVHQNERKITMESVRLIKEMGELEPWFFLHMTLEEYANHIGLSYSMFYKRLLVGRIMERFPRVVEMYEKGETSISHIAMIANKLTPANQDLLLEAIRNKSKREVEAFISRVTKDGNIQEKPELVEICFRVTVDQRAKMERAREFLAHAGYIPTNGDLFEEAFDQLIKHKDPIQKAERAEARFKKMLEKKAAKVEVIDLVKPAVELDDIEDEEEDEEDDRDEYNYRSSHGRSLSWGSFERTPIPAATRHAVWLRDRGQCTYVNGKHVRCPERMMIELDHIKMVCRGGTNEVENLRLRCRYHNQAEARRSLRYGPDGKRAWDPHPTAEVMLAT